ncbi:efflux RND transporter permease subunit [Candidatus Saganbacteria bacterium]|nr:efflux RND transporter permease subunit [Candidatus Saganbacteria bacterium]
MVDKLIEYCLRHRVVTIALFAFLMLWGVWAIFNTPIDAIPDIGDKQVIVFADWPGRSPQNIEDQVTYPLTTALQGVPGVKVIRSSSAFGFSMIYVIIEDHIDYYWARSRILERLNVVQERLPKGVMPVLGPDATGLGQIFWYTVEGKGYDLAQLRSIEDWYIRYQLNSVPGVAEVGSVGGFVKEYQVDIDPNRLAAYKVKAGEVFNAVKNSNLDVGAKVIEKSSMEYVLRGLGFIKSVKDIEDIVVKSHEGVPVYLKNLGRVTLGPAFRRGVLDKGGEEAVGGVVVMRYGENPLKVIEGVKQKIKELEPGLPKGVKIVPFYDRTGLIYDTIDTLRSALFQEVAITVLVILFFLLHFSSTVIVSLILPVGVLMAFIGMYYLKIDSNIMSLGGIAIAIGMMVDYGIIVTENIFRHLAEKKDGANIVETTLTAAKEISSPLIIAMLTTVIGFIPVFVLHGEEGKLFRPLAYTKTFAMGGALLISLMLIPVLCTFFLKGKLRLPEENYVSRKMREIYEPALRWALDHKLKVMIATLIVVLLGFGSVFFIGREFMPPLDEGSILFMPVMHPSVSLTQAHEILKKQDQIIRSFPEVLSVGGKLGRAETATDPAPVEMFETVIMLKPKDQWRPGLTKDKLIQEMDRSLRIPGVSNIWTQPIVNRIAMLSTGIRTNVGVKLFGPDLKTLEHLGREVEEAVKDIKGATDVYAEKIVGKPYLEIEIKREAIARYGIPLNDVQEVIEMAVGGEPLTYTVEGRERYPVRARYFRELRDNLEAIKRVLVPTMDGAQIPLAQLADIRITTGPAMISSENGLLRAYVLMNVRGRDMVGFVEEASKIVASKVKLPQGYFLQWSGEFENQVSAKRQLMIVVPLAFFVIFVILYMGFNSFSQLFIVLLGLPVSLSGGLLLQRILGYNFSVAVWVGYIALVGVATDAGVLMISILNDIFLKKEIRNREEVRQAVVEGGLLRLRPILMTVATTILALMAVMWGSGTGSEIMKPMAAPTVGGLITATLLNLFVVPVLYAWIKERRFKA